MIELKATTAQEIVRKEKDCDYMDELFGGVKMPPTQVYLKSEVDKVIADLEASHKKEVGQLLMEIAELKAQKAQVEDDCAYWRTKAQNSATDKYISELKKERDWLAKDRAQAYDDLEKRAQLNIKQEESIRHQKYKRCLTMAKWCNDRYILDDCLYELGKTRYYERWEKRWLKIAEKFKETK